MKCMNCGMQMPEEAMYCTNCGAPLAAQNGTPGNGIMNNGMPNSGMMNNGMPDNAMPNNGMQGQPENFMQYQNPMQYGQQMDMGIPMTKSQFSKHPNMKKCRSNILGSAIILYVCAAITFLLNVVVMKNIYGMADVMILVGLALGIQLAKSRVCAVIIMIYSILNVFYMIIETGRIGGYLVVIAAVWAVVYTFKFQDAWQTYLRTGMVPMI